MERVIKIIQIRNFPADLHKRTKIQAAKEETTMKAIIVKALTEYLERAEG
jgi:plasmid stability protein